MPRRRATGSSSTVVDASPADAAPVVKRSRSVAPAAQDDEAEQSSSSQDAGPASRRSKRMRIEKQEQDAQNESELSGDDAAAAAAESADEMVIEEGENAQAGPSRSSRRSGGVNGEVQERDKDG